MSYFAQKKNRIIQISEEKAEEYSRMGYTITEKNGEVVMEAAIASVADAKRKIEDLRKENAELKKENDKLKEAIKAQSAIGVIAQEGTNSGKKPSPKTSGKSE